SRVVVAARDRSERADRDHPKRAPSVHREPPETESTPRSTSGGFPPISRRLGTEMTIYVSNTARPRRGGQISIRPEAWRRFVRLAARAVAASARIVVAEREAHREAPSQVCEVTSRAGAGADKSRPGPRPGGDLSAWLRAPSLQVRESSWRSVKLTAKRRRQWAKS